MKVGGPMFEPRSTAAFKKQECMFCRRSSDGAHYSLFQIKGGVQALREFFPEAKADEMNFCLFSTSGVHGSYTSIEQIEASLNKYGDDPSFPNEGDYPDDYCGNSLTVLIVQPRICCLRYGNVEVAKDDIDFLKRLRKSSWAAVQTIGRAEAELEG